MDGTSLVGASAAVIIERPTCLRCVARKIGTTELATVRALERIGTALRIVVQPSAVCESCGSSLGPVYWLQRRIAGSSDVDVPLIASVLGGASLCGDCIARKTGIARARVDEALERIGRSLALPTANGRCDACLKTTAVHRLG
jgi:hypothetical protein